MKPFRRKSIYIRRALADRMDQFPKTNWSEVACSAFEQYMGPAPKIELSAAQKLELIKDILR